MQPNEVEDLIRKSQAVLAQSAVAQMRFRLAMAQLLAMEDPGALGERRFGWTTRTIVDQRGRDQLLTDTEWRVLHVLVKANGRVVSRAAIAAEVWGLRGSRLSEVEVYISRLRRKFGGGRDSVIATVRGEGYRLVPMPRGPSA